jgi:hypothetical protein
MDNNDHEKLAAAYHELGRIMAIGFQDEMGKQASASSASGDLFSRFGQTKEASPMGFMRELAERAGTSLKEMGEQAYGAARSGAQRARNAGGDAAKRTQEQMQNMQAGLSQFADRAGQSAQAAGQRARAAGRLGRQRARQFARENPGQAALGAGAAGVGLGAGGAAAMNASVSDKEASAENPILARL